MEVLSAKQVAEIWGTTARRVQELCRDGKIPYAMKHNGNWLIPEEVCKKAVEAGLVSDSTASENQSNRIYSGIIDMYKSPGSASELMMSLADDEFSYDMFASQLYFYQGKHKESLELALRHYDENEKDLGHRIAVGLQLMLATIYSGDIKLWRRGREYILNSECHDERLKKILDFWAAIGSSSLSDNLLFPEWFKRGDFTCLPKNAFSVASYNYAKYLYVVSAENPEISLEIMHTMPRIVEPLISYVSADGVVLMEIYLRLVCALAYHIIGNDSLAIPHLDRAISLALPDKLYSPLAEYRRRFGFLMDDRIALQSETALSEIKSVSKVLIEGWIKLHNEILGRSVSNALSTREWQAARLAAYGLPNKEIAERMGVTVNAVKQALRMAMDKTGARSRSEIGKYL